MEINLRYLKNRCWPVRAHFSDRAVMKLLLYVVGKLQTWLSCCYMKDQLLPWWSVAGVMILGATKELECMRRKQKKQEQQSTVLFSPCVFPLEPLLWKNQSGGNAEMWTEEALLQQHKAEDRRVNVMLRNNPVAGTVHTLSDSHPHLPFHTIQPLYFHLPCNYSFFIYTWQ